jgi:hypothetical protein
MKTLFLLGVTCFCALVWGADPTAMAAASAPVMSTSQSTAFPTETERNEERVRLTRLRQALEDTYKQDMRQCYQKFDVTSCRLQARDRRIDANKVLREDELRFNAMERQIQADETRSSVAERNSEAELKKAQAQRAASVAASKEHADANAQKQIDHALQGTKRGDYEQRQREAAQHKADLEKKLRERNKEPAAPLPVPSR